MDDPRSAEEKQVAEHARARLIEEGQVGDDLPIAQNNTILLGEYDTVTAPPPKKQPPPLRPNVDCFDDYFRGTPFQGIMSTLEMQLYREHVPKYWDSEEYFTKKAEAEVAAATAAAEVVAAAEAQAQAAEGDSDVMKACKAFFKAQTNIMDHTEKTPEKVEELRSIMLSACAESLGMQLNEGADDELVSDGSFDHVMSAVWNVWKEFVHTRNEIVSFEQVADAVVVVTQLVDHHLPDSSTGIPLPGTVNVGLLCTHTLTYDGDGKIAGWAQEFDGSLLSNARAAATASEAAVSVAADEADVVSPLAAAAEAKAAQPKLVATRPMLKSFRPLPPIQPAATTLHASPAELVFNFEDAEAPAVQVVKLNNFGASTVRLRISDVPAGIAVEQMLSPIAAGLSLEVSVEVDPKAFDDSQTSQKVRIMTTAGTVTIPITLKYPEPLAAAEDASAEAP